MKTYRKAIALLLSCFMCICVMTSCEEKKTEVERNENGVAISIPYAFSESPNPFYAESEGDLAILALIVERYFTTPDVASLEKEVTDDGLYQVTVTVKNGVKFSNSRGASSSDLIHAIYLVCDPSYDGPYGALGKSSLLGLESFRKGESSTIEGVKKLDIYSCMLTFERSEDFEALLDLPVVNAGEYGSVVFGKCAADDFTATYATVIGSGPYAVNDRLEKTPKAIGLERNKWYGHSLHSHFNVTIFCVADRDVGANLQMRQLVAGIVLDEAAAKEQAKRYGVQAVKLADGYLLCRDKINATLEDYSSLKVLSTVLKLV